MGIRRREELNGSSFFVILIHEYKEITFRKFQVF